MPQPGLATWTTLVVCPAVCVGAWGLAGRPGALLIAPIALVTIWRHLRSRESSLGAALSSRRARWAPAPSCSHFCSSRESGWSFAFEGVVPATPPAWLVLLTLALRSAAIAVNAGVLVAAGTARRASRPRIPLRSAP